MNTPLEIGDRVRVRRDIVSGYRDMVGTVEALFDYDAVLVSLDDVNLPLAFAASEVWRFRSVHGGWTHDCDDCRQRLAERIASGQCALADGQCLTHGVPDTTDHHFSVHPDANTD